LNKYRLPFTCIRRKGYDKLTRELAVAESLVEHHTTPPAKDVAYPAKCVIFSKDRALQLHALLSSYFENATEPAPVYILYQSSTRAHQKAYEEIFSMFHGRQIMTVAQKSAESFKDQLILILESIEATRVLFLVDDIIFIEKVDMGDFTKFDTRTIIPSLRMGANLKRAYTVQQNQALPVFIPQVINDEDKLCWIWANGVYDWAYPLSVDGHLFSTQEISIFAKYTNFNSPNTFEANLQEWAKYFKHRYGICYKKSKILNIPANRVQNDINNIHGTVHQDYLLEQWNRGMQMDYCSLYGLVNESAHQDVPITLIKRRE
jgi:hypothetical protein